jgi:type I restriction enzyme, S subunit
MNSIKIGTIQAHFNVSTMSELPLPVPPLDTQREAIAALTEATRVIDGLSDKLARQVLLLEEHRQALITAAVTGELDVTERMAADGHG